MEPLPGVFDMSQYLETILPLVETFYNILWVVALLKACDVTNNGRHLGFYQELEMRSKSWMPTPPPPCLVRPRVNYLPYLKHSVVGCPSPYTLRYTCTVLLVFSVTPFKIDQNKNQNR